MKMEKVDEKLANLIEKLQDAGFAQAPEVVEGAIRAISFTGSAQLGAALVSLIFLIISFSCFIYSLKVDNPAIGVPSVILAIMFFFTTVITSVLENPWLKAFDPEAYLYLKILEGIF